MTSVAIFIAELIESSGVEIDGDKNIRSRHVESDIGDGSDNARGVHIYDRAKDGHGFSFVLFNLPIILFDSEDWSNDNNFDGQVTPFCPDNGGSDDASPEDAFE